MCAVRNLPSTRCLRLVWGAEHSRLTSAGARPGSCELLSAAPGEAPPEGHPGHGRLQAPARAAVRQRGRGLGRLFPGRCGRGAVVSAGPGLAQAVRGSPLRRPPGRSHGQEPPAGHGAAAGARAGAALLRAGGGAGRPAAAPLRRGWVSRPGLSGWGARPGPPVEGGGGGWGAARRGRPGRGLLPARRWRWTGGDKLRCPCLRLLSLPRRCCPHITRCRSIPCPNWLRPHVAARSATGLFSGTGGYPGFIFSCAGRPAGEVRWALPCFWRGVPRHALQTPRLGAVLGCAGSKHTHTAWRACRWAFRNGFPRNSHSMVLTLASEQARNSVPAFLLSPVGRRHGFTNFGDHLSSLIPEIKLYGAQSCGACSAIGWACDLGKNQFISVPISQPLPQIHVCLYQVLQNWQKEITHIYMKLEGW